MRVAVKSHTLPVYKKNRIASLLCIFKTTIKLILSQIRYNVSYFFAKILIMYRKKLGSGGVC